MGTTYQTSQQNAPKVAADYNTVESCYFTVVGDDTEASVALDPNVSFAGSELTVEDVGVYSITLPIATPAAILGYWASSNVPGVDIALDLVGGELLVSLTLPTFDTDAVIFSPYPLATDELLTIRLDIGRQVTA